MDEQVYSLKLKFSEKRVAFLDFPGEQFEIDGWFTSIKYICMIA